MGRPAKHNWAALFTEFIRDEWPSIAAFARARRLNVNQVRDEFRKLNGTRSRLVDAVVGEAEETVGPEEPTGNRPTGNRPTGNPRRAGKQKIIEGLTDKQALFVFNYLIDFNATRAAIAAGYSKRSAYAVGHDNLLRPAVQRELQKYVGSTVRQLGLDAQRIVMEYMKIAFADIGEYVTFGQRDVQVMGAFGPLYEGKGKNKKPIMKRVSYVNFKESDMVDTGLISEVRQGREGVSIKLADKMKALEKLERYLDVIPDAWRRRIEEGKLQLERERFDLEKTKVEGGGDINDLLDEALDAEGLADE